MQNKIGFGSKHSTINVYIENRPPLDEYLNLDSLKALQSGEIDSIAKQTGNHWRKIFNVYSKLAFLLLAPKQHETWQHYRDHCLLQAENEFSLLFSPLVTSLNKELHIISGKTYAEKLGFHEKVHWISPDFAINQQERIIICPYFDYRQLSNIKIEQLVTLINNQLTFVANDT